MTEGDQQSRARSSMVEHSALNRGTWVRFLAGLPLKWSIILTTVVCIHWVDITGDGGWVTEDQFIEPAPVVSCGILVKEDEENLWLAMDMAVEEGAETIYNSTGVFPKCVIRERIEVEIDLE